MLIAYREIADVVNHQINLKIPDYIKSDKVEIIVIPCFIPEEITPEIDFNKFFGVSNIGTEKINLQLQKLRDEWDGTILD